MRALPDGGARGCFDHKVPSRPGVYGLTEQPHRAYEKRVVSGSRSGWDRQALRSTRDAAGLTIEKAWGAEREGLDCEDGCSGGPFDVVAGGVADRRCLGAGVAELSGLFLERLMADHRESHHFTRNDDAVGKGEVADGCYQNAEPAGGVTHNS